MLYKRIRIDGLKRKYKSWHEHEKYIACTSYSTKTDELVSCDDLHSFELCAGEEVMSKALAKVGFTTHTLDNDTKRSATSKLSLDQLEDQIINRCICDHPYLPKCPSVVWAAPECRTWSIASSGRYRNRDFIDGFPNR